MTCSSWGRAQHRFGTSRGVSPLRLAQKPAEVGPSSPCHDSSHWEGDLLWQCSDQLLHCFHHGLGICAVWQLRHIKSGKAWRNGGLWIFLLDKGQKPAERDQSRDTHLSLLVGSCHSDREQPGLLRLSLEIDIRALKSSSGLRILLLISPPCAVREVWAPVSTLHLVITSTRFSKIVTVRAGPFKHPHINRGA